MALITPKSALPMLQVLPIGALGALFVHGQDCPTKPSGKIVLCPPADGTDSVARTRSESLSKALGPPADPRRAQAAGVRHRRSEDPTRVSG